MKILAIISILIFFVTTTWSFSIFKENSDDKLKEAKDSSSNHIHKLLDTIKFDKKPPGFVPSQVKCKSLSRHNFFLIFFTHTVTSFEKCDPCPKEANCVPAIQCPAHLRMSKHPQLCDLPGNSRTHGLCCTTKQNHTDAHGMKKKSSSERSMDDNSIFHEATHEFDAIMHEQAQQQRPALVQKDNIIEPDFFHQMVFGNHRPSDAAEVHALVNSGKPKKEINLN